jgi:hypothetical protein
MDIMAADVGTGTTVTFNSVAIGELTNVSGPGLSVETFDTSSMDSVSWKSFIAGDLVDGGEIELEIWHESDAAIPAIGGAAATLVILWAGDAGNDWSCSAILTGYDPTSPLEGLMTATYKFKVTGAVTEPA